MKHQDKLKEIKVESIDSSLNEIREMIAFRRGLNSHRIRMFEKRRKVVERFGFPGFQMKAEGCESDRIPSCKWSASWGTNLIF